MKKFLTKITGFILGAAMIVGVGAGIGLTDLSNKNAPNVSIAAEDDTHDFAQSISVLLNNKASVPSINISDQGYNIKEIIIEGSHNKTNLGVDATVKIGTTSFGTKKIGGTNSSYSISFTGDSTSGAVSISFVNNNTGTGKGTLNITNVCLVEGGSSKTLTGVTLTGGTCKKEYVASEYFDATGLNIQAEFDSGEPLTINPVDDMTWNSGNPLTVGTTQVTGYYNQDKNSSFPITITGLTVTEYVAPKFAKYTGAIKSGQYLVVADSKAMTYEVNSNRLQFTSVTITNDIIEIDFANKKAIWTIASSGDYWTMFNGESKQYAASTGAKNQATMSDTASDDKTLWNITGTTNKVITNKYNVDESLNSTLRKNGTYGFACYAAETGSEPVLYKLVEPKTDAEKIQDLVVDYIGTNGEYTKKTTIGINSDVVTEMTECFHANQTAATRTTYYAPNKLLLANTDGTISVDSGSYYLQDGYVRRSANTVEVTETAEIWNHLDEGYVAYADPAESLEERFRTLNSFAGDDYFEGWAWNETNQNYAITVDATTAFNPGETWAEFLNFCAPMLYASASKYFTAEKLTICEKTDKSETKYLELTMYITSSSGEGKLDTPYLAQARVYKGNSVFAENI